MEYQEIEGEIPLCPKCKTTNKTVVTARVSGIKAIWYTGYGEYEQDDDSQVKHTFNKVKCVNCNSIRKDLSATPNILIIK